MAWLLRWELSHVIPEKRARRSPTHKEAVLAAGLAAGEYTFEDVLRLLEDNENLLARLSSCGHAGPSAQRRRYV